MPGDTGVLDGGIYRHVYVLLILLGQLQICIPFLDI
jgi:hypothetical protein